MSAYPGPTVLIPGTPERDAYQQQVHAELNQQSNPSKGGAAVSDIDPAAIKSEHSPFTTAMAGHTCAHCAELWPCLPYRLAAALERAQAAAEGVDMLIAQAERRGAVKALQKVGSAMRQWGGENEARYAWDAAEAIANGSTDL